MPLFEGLPCSQLNVPAVLAGLAPGEVYVDNVEHPLNALLVSADARYLVGRADPVFAEAVNALLPRDDYFVLFADERTWGPALKILLRGTFAIRAPRVIHEWIGPSAAARIPDDYELRPIDAQLLSEGLDHIGTLRASILYQWSSIDAFLSHGYGVCAVQRGEIASWALADYVWGDAVEFGVETQWVHRRKGLGEAVAAAAVVEARARGLKHLFWHCWVNNVGSRRIAAKVGFVERSRYFVHINHWAAENIADMSRGEFHAFARGYERRLAAESPESGFPHVVAAKAWMLAGEPDRAFRRLNVAIDMGWLSTLDQLYAVWPEIEFVPDLESLPQWQALCARLGEPLAAGSVASR